MEDTSKWESVLNADRTREGATFARRFTSLGVRLERPRHSSNPAASQQHFLLPPKQRSSKSGGNDLGTQTRRSQLLTDYAYFGILGICGQLNS